MGRETCSVQSCTYSWKDLAQPSRLGCSWPGEDSPFHATGSSLPIEGTRL